jgi:transposase
VLVHLVADYGMGDLAFAEVAQRLVQHLLDAQVVLTPVPAFDTLSAGFCIAQLALTFEVPAGETSFAPGSSGWPTPDGDLVWYELFARGTKENVSSWTSGQFCAILWRMAKKGRRATNEERLAAIQMYDNGLSADRIAEIMGVSRSSVFDWIANYREGGLAAISTKFASGHPTALADSEMIQLFTMINGKDPRAYSFGVALWTRSLIRDLIKKKFSKDVSLVTVGRILKKLGMSPQRPLYRAWKQDPARVEKWKREEYPAIKARAAEMGATILFADEASVRTDYHAGTTWAPVGQTPVVTGSAVRHAVKMVSAIGQRGELSFQVCEGSMNAERFIEFLEALLHDFDTPIFLVVDGSSVHKAKIVKEYVAGTGGRLELFFLPPYSPELNPDEWVNKNVKHDRIAKAVPLTKDELKAIAVEALERLKKCPGIVRGFFGDPKLAYVHA